jgi:hypothetical protein
MSLIHIGIYIILIAASYLAWKKYDDKLMRWCFWVAIIAFGAWIWQFALENIGTSDAIRTLSLYVVQVLRVTIMLLLAVAGIRIFNRKIFIEEEF